MLAEVTTMSDSIFGFMVLVVVAAIGAACAMSIPAIALRTVFAGLSQVAG
jgi:hypothetical protein